MWKISIVLYPLYANQGFLSNSCPVNVKFMLQIYFSQKPQKVQLGQKKWLRLKLRSDGFKLMRCDQCGHVSHFHKCTLCLSLMPPHAVRKRASMRASAQVQVRRLCVSYRALACVLWMYKCDSEIIARHSWKFARASAITTTVHVTLSVCPLVAVQLN